MGVVDVRNKSPPGRGFQPRHDGPLSRLKCHILLQISYDLDIIQRIKSILEFPPPCKTHHVVRINRSPDLPKPLHIPTIHVFQRRAIKRVIYIQRCVRHILPICKSSSVDCVRYLAQGRGHSSIERGVGPLYEEVRRKDSA